MAFTEASSPGPGRAWRGGFMLAKVLGNSHATHESGLALINCIVADHSQLCYTICIIKAPPQAFPWPGEEPLWHLS